MTDTPDAVILLSRGGTGAAAREALQHLAAELQQRGAASQVIVGFIDKAAPSLPEALDLCAGARCVAVVPLVAPDEPTLQRWLHKVAMRWRARRGAALPRIVFAPPLMAAGQLPHLVCDQIAQALQAEDVAETAGPQWAQDPVAWSDVPEHQHHVLVCTGPRCTSKGAVAMWQSLGECLKASPELHRKIRPLQTGCLHPCNLGPTAIVYPEGVWYGRLDAQNITQVMHAHFLQGPPLKEHVVHRLQATEPHPSPSTNDSQQEPPCTSNPASSAAPRSS